MTKDSQQGIITKLFPSWTCIDNYVHAELRRIWILHDQYVRMEMFSSTNQAIHCHAYSLTLKRYFLLSVIYACNGDVGRRALCQDLCNIHACAACVACLIVGDFNVILNMNESSDHF